MFKARQYFQYCLMRCEHAQLLQSCLTLPESVPKEAAKNKKEKEGMAIPFCSSRKSGSLVFLTTLSVGDAHCF